MNARWGLLLAALTAAALVFAACGDDDDNSQPPAKTPPAGQATANRPDGGQPTRPPNATQAPQSPTAAATATSALPAFKPASTVTKTTATSSAQAILTDVRVGKNDGYDRVVFEFRGNTLPGYEIKYVPSVVQCGSGKPVTTSGPAQMSVVFQPAAAHDGANSTVANRDINAGLGSVKQVKDTCDFEGQVGWVIGTLEKPYRVIELQNPTRLAIDIQQ